MDYDAVDDAPTALYPWQPEDDLCLRQLVGNATGSKTDWKSVAAQFNQKRGASPQETEWLQHPRALKQNEAPIARTDKALQARWDQLQELKIDKKNDIVKNGVKCRVCEHIFTYSDISPESIDKMFDEQDDFICDFCVSIGATDVQTTSWGLHTDMSEASCDATKSLELLEADIAGILGSQPWEDDGLQDAPAVGPQESSEDQGRQQVQSRKKRRYELDDKVDKQVSSDDEAGELLRRHHVPVSLHSKQRLVGVAGELTALEVQMDENGGDLESALTNATTGHGWWL
jgi:hypothetical protein